MADADRREREAEESLLQAENNAHAPPPSAAPVPGDTNRSPPSSPPSLETANASTANNGDPPATAAVPAADVAVDKAEQSQKGAVRMAAEKKHVPRGGGEEGVVGGGVEKKTDLKIDQKIDPRNGSSLCVSPSPVDGKGKDISVRDSSARVGEGTATAPSAALAAATMAGERSGRVNSNPGAGGGRFIQRDMEAARLMLRARKLDLAAREWVGVRGLLLRRATAKGRGGKPGVAAHGAGGGDDGSPGRRKVSEHCATLVLRPTVGSERDSGGGKVLPVLEGLEGFVERVSSEGGGVVVETPEEAVGLGDVGVGWGGWNAGGTEKVSKGVQ